MSCTPKVSTATACVNSDDNDDQDKQQRLDAIDDQIIQDFPELTCPISMGILDDAVLASDMMTYSRRALLECSKYSTRSPLTRKKLVTTHQHNVIVFPNCVVNNIVATLRILYRNTSPSTPMSGEKMRRCTFIHELRSLLMCPLSHELFSDPVTSSDNITYNRDALRKYVRTFILSPATNKDFVRDCNGSVLIFRNLLVKQLASIIEQTDKIFCLAV